jgi:hypothetical protein
MERCFAQCDIHRNASLRVRDTRDALARISLPSFGQGAGARVQ